MDDIIHDEDEKGLDLGPEFEVEVSDEPKTKDLTWSEMGTAMFNPNTRQKKAPPEDFSMPKPGVFGSPFRPSIGPNGELIPAIVPLEGKKR